MNDQNRQLLAVLGLFVFFNVASISAAPPDSSVARTDALERLSEPWSEPAPVRTASAPAKKRLRPSAVSYGAAQELSECPDDAELFCVDFLPEPLVPVPGEAVAGEREALATALCQHKAGTGGPLAPLDGFVAAHPDSRWTPAVLLNLGLIAYQTGYFSSALDYWQSAWEASREGTDNVSETIANRAIAEYAKMNARIGRKDVLATVLSEVEGRTFQGKAAVVLDAARQGLWAMRNKGGIAYRCGPYALTNIAEELLPGSESACAQFLESVVSPDTGFSLEEVQAQSAELGLETRMAKRSVGAEVIIPSVVHWKVGHYGALIRELNGRYLLKDPTFGNQTWMDAAAIDAEASGYFIVPSGDSADLPEGWRPADLAEAAAVFGKGHSGDGGEDETGQCDKKSGGDGCGGLAMATYSFHTLLASLSVTDTPVGYPAAYGPDVRLRVTHNQRENSQPTTGMAFTQFSPGWVCNWVSWLEDDPGNSGADIDLRLRGGGSETHTGYDEDTQIYGSDVQTSAYLVRLSANSYKKVYPDSSEEHYGHYIGTSGTRRKVFLSKVVDPQGNAVLLQYDARNRTRLQYIHDATGLTTEFFYGNSVEPYLVTKVEDPYGRTAEFTYGSVAGAVRLTDIEDVYGIVSSFGYDRRGWIDQLTTPYGTTTFELSDFKIGRSYDLIRYIEATDPYGDKERIEYNLSDEETGLPYNIDEPLPDNEIVDYRLSDNDDRNSFYWDKQQMHYGAGDYSRAHLYHWLQPDTHDSATSILESEKPPLEGRIWYNYPGQPEPYIQGDLARPSVIGRVVEDEAGALVTQAARFEYNEMGNITRQIDPSASGRETRIDYAANGIDITSIRQRTGGTDDAPTYATLARYTYDPTHRPRTFTDSSGNTTTFRYTAEGQIRTVTNQLGEVITFTYETNPANNGYGRLLTITGDVPGGNTTYTYDGYDRIRTATDSEGHTLTYDYDALDRVTVITYPDGSYEQFDYENHSLVASRDREGRWTRTLHDALRRPVLQRDPLGQLTQYEWCRCGDLRKLIDGNRNITHWKRDVQGRVTAKEFADGTEYAYAYWPLSGQLHRSTGALDQTATHSYYIDGNLQSIDYSAANTPDERFTYDTYYDRMASRTDGSGTTTYTYHPDDGATNGAGFIARVNGPHADDTRKYTYDALERLKKREIVDDATFTTASYSEEYGYDTRSRVKKVVNNLGTFDFAYIGQSGRMDTVDAPNGMVTDYSYVDAGGDHLLEQIRHRNAASTPAVLSQYDYTYRQDRNIETWTTTQNGATGKLWTFGYDDARRLATARRTNTGTQAVLEQFAYNYDKAGNRIGVTTGTAHTNYPANNLNQTTARQGQGPTRIHGTVDEPARVTVNGEDAIVLSQPGGNYLFRREIPLAEGDNTVTIEATDGSGNTATQSYSVTVGGVQKTLQYDANGNLRFEKDPSGTILREFKWDAKNRLVKIINGTRTSEFSYDGLDRRVRVVEKTDGVEQSNQVYLWDGTEIVQKRASDGSTVQRNYFDQGFEEGDNDYYYTKDHLGSIREVVASDGLTVESVYDYSPWGEVKKVGGSGVESDFLYTGHYHHSPSDLHLALYRAYNPALGMWLSRDPLESVTGELAELLPEGPNLYTYVGNDPISYIDEDGQFGIVGAFVAIVATYVVAETIAAAIEAIAATNALCNMDNSAVTQGGSMGNPSFSSQMNDIQNAVHDMAVGSPNTSLTGPAGVPGRLSEAVGEAANGILRACGK